MMHLKMLVYDVPPCWKEVDLDACLQLFEDSLLADQYLLIDQHYSCSDLCALPETLEFGVVVHPEITGISSETVISVFELTIAVE